MKHYGSSGSRARQGWRLRRLTASPPGVDALCKEWLGRNVKKPWNYGSSAIIAGSCGLLQLAAVVRNGFYLLLIHAACDTWWSICHGGACHGSARRNPLMDTSGTKLASLYDESPSAKGVNNTHDCTCIYRFRIDFEFHHSGSSTSQQLQKMLD